MVTTRRCVQVRPGRVGTTRLRMLAASGVLAGVALALAGCVDAGNDSGSPGDAGGGPKPDTNAQVQAFEEACERGVNGTPRGQLDYPETLVLQFHESVNYNAAIDLSNRPLPPDQVIDIGEGTPGTQSVEASCRVQAMLESVGDHVKIDGSSSSDWVQREFSPSGMVEWSWTVTVDEPVNQKVRLRLQPVAFLGDDSYGGLREETVTTAIQVNAHASDRVAHFLLETKSGLLAIIATIVALAVATGVGWKQIRKAFGNDKDTGKGDRPAPDPAPDPAPADK